jgi:F-type H+-transporting ATPase subunit delta
VFGPEIRREKVVSSAVFARYARSLADVVFDAGQETPVTADLKTYMEIFQAVPDLLEVFDSPAIRREAKERLLSNLVGRYPVAKTTENFLLILLRNNRIRYFAEIFENYLKLINIRKDIVSAQVTVAVPLSETEIQGLNQSLAQAASKTVTLDVRTDADLLGGLVVQIGSTVYDGSIRTQLSEMKRRLADI